MDVTLHIPVRRYVFKYCKTLFGDPWRLTTRHKEGIVLHAMLKRMPHRYEKYHRDDEILSLQIPAKIVCQKGVYLTQEDIDAFNDYIKQVILDEIFQFHTAIQSRVGLKAIDKVSVNQYMADKRVRLIRLQPAEATKFFWQKQIITDILSKYDITEDDLSSDSVVKHLQRYSSARYLAS
ncbi:hypothetical protein J3L18_05390 [Mucilaginibacter gossypii]|uniref:hypothetical protein n=1 Tax=Mucilaginibacter gossypii TaxID=551996 RepID=UPI000DCF3AA2|nr:MULTISPECIES: hypothetical protein [Mucilaginibacter]QTE38512.1 hypothetical protein J3L18_05390 [Mucilaginibacter gossypii]RAV55751.1 hypothetical protein DIU36_16805 [Mucilaginibacter rubeus]